jgi:hypothetical protein
VRLSAIGGALLNDCGQVLQGRFAAHFIVVGPMSPGTSWQCAVISVPSSVSAKLVCDFHLAGELRINSSIRLTAKRRGG